MQRTLWNGTVPHGVVKLVVIYIFPFNWEGFDNYSDENQSTTNGFIGYGYIGNTLLSHITLKI